MGGVQSRDVNEALHANLAGAARDELRGLHVHVAVGEVHRRAHHTRADQIHAHVRVLERALHTRLVKNVRRLQKREAEKFILKKFLRSKREEKIKPKRT